MRRTITTRGVCAASAAEGGCARSRSASTASSARKTARATDAVSAIGGPAVGRLAPGARSGALIGSAGGAGPQLAARRRHERRRGGAASCPRAGRCGRTARAGCERGGARAACRAAERSERTERWIVAGGQAHRQPAEREREGREGRRDDERGVEEQVAFAQARASLPG